MPRRAPEPSKFDQNLAMLNALLGATRTGVDIYGGIKDRQMRQQEFDLDQRLGALREQQLNADLAEQKRRITPLPFGQQLSYSGMDTGPLPYDITPENADMALKTRGLYGDEAKFRAYQEEEARNRLPLEQTLPEELVTLLRGSSLGFGLNMPTRDQGTLMEMLSRQTDDAREAGYQQQQELAQYDFSTPQGQRSTIDTQARYMEDLLNMQKATFGMPGEQQGPQPDLLLSLAEQMYPIYASGMGRETPEGRSFLEMMARDPVLPAYREQALQTGMGQEVEGSPWKTPEEAQSFVMRYADLANQYAQLAPGSQRMGWDPTLGLEGVSYQPGIISFQDYANAYEQKKNQIMQEAAALAGDEFVGPRQEDPFQDTLGGLRNAGQEVWRGLGTAVGGIKKGLTPRRTEARSDSSAVRR